MAVKQTDIARAAGVSQFTVSRALCNDPIVAKETRQRIQKIAEEMGYIKNPIISQVMSNVRGGGEVDRYVKVGIIGEFDFDEWISYPAGRDVYAAIKRRANASGSSVEYFQVTDDEDQQQRLSNNLFSRGIDVIIFASFIKARDLSKIDFSHYTLVATCRSLLSPKVNLVNKDITASARMMINYGIRNNYKRLGMVSDAHINLFNDREWLSTFHDYQAQIPENERVPILSELFDNDEPRRTEVFMEWYQKYKPDIIYTDTSELPINYFIPMIEKANEKQPKWFTMIKTKENVAGLHFDFDHLGETAFDLGLFNFLKGHKGVPKRSFKLLMAGELDEVDSRSIEVRDEEIRRSYFLA